MGIFSIEQKDNKKILSVKSPVDFRTVGTYECASTEDVKSAMQKSRDAQKHFHNSQNEREVVSRLVKLFNIESDALKQMRGAVYKQNPFQVSAHLQYLMDNRPKHGVIDSIINKEGSN